LSSLEDLFGEPSVLFKEKANYKLPGCRPDKAHQDQAASWNTYTDFFITMAMFRMARPPIAVTASNSSDSQRRNIYLTFNKASAGDLRQQYYDDKWKNYPPNQVSTARKDSTFRV